MLSLHANSSFIGIRCFGGGVANSTWYRWVWVQGLDLLNLRVLPDISGISYHRTYQVVGMIYLPDMFCGSMVHPPRCRMLVSLPQWMVKAKLVFAEGKLPRSTFQPTRLLSSQRSQARYSLLQPSIGCHWSRRRSTAKSMWSSKDNVNRGSLGGRWSMVKAKMAWWKQKWPRWRPIYRAKECHAIFSWSGFGLPSSSFQSCTWVRTSWPERIKGLILGLGWSMRPQLGSLVISIINPRGNKEPNCD